MTDAAVRTDVNLLQFRLGVTAVMTRKDGKVLVFNCSDFPDSWQFPQGGIDSGEDPDQAVLREIKEETGIAADKLFLRDSTSHFIPMVVPENLRNRRFSDNGWIGHAQKWFLFDFSGTDSDIDFSQEHCFQGFAWVLPDEAVRRVVFFKQPAYRTALSQLGFELTFC